MTGDIMTARSGSAMGLSTRSVSGLVGEDESVTGVSSFFAKGFSASEEGSQAEEGESQASGGFDLGTESLGRDSTTAFLPFPLALFIARYRRRVKHSR